MSAHPHERLSAFLDDELAAQERGEIEQHLRTCAECAQELSELALLDRLGRALEIEVPEGYLEALPARLRPRLRTARPARRRIVPMWALAAAALVLIGLLVPITWQRHRPELSAPTPESRAAAPAPEQHAERASEPAPTVAPSATAPQSVRLTVPAASESIPAERPQAIDRVGQDFAAPPRATQPAARPEADEYSKANDDLKALGYSGNAQRELREEPAKPRADDARTRQFGPTTGGAPAATAPGRAPANAPTAVPPPTAPPAATGAAVAKSAAPPPPAAPEPAVAARTATGTLELDDESARAKRERGAADSFEAIEREDRRDEEPKLSKKARSESFAEIANRPLHTAAEARRQRRAWREFADLHASDPRADEARVRAVEAAARAYVLSGDARDKQTLAEDLKDYLRRDDAKQKDRVRVLSAP
jgi:Putative zinc-finger